mmetsp:Transcript_7678/g.8444  ORF Transcript_7678/g.8444 Transcript_7678/m.8444 type:complete len:554 (+) Transcript_7678:180-1841(+)
MEHSEYLFQLVLRDPEAFELFQTFLKSEYANENLDFFLAIESFRKHLKTDNESAIAIYTQFFVEDNINVSGPTAQKLVNCFKQKKFCRDSFQKAQYEIYINIVTDLFNRFRNNKLWKEFTYKRENSLQDILRDDCLSEALREYLYENGREHDVMDFMMSVIDFKQVPDKPSELQKHGNELIHRYFTPVQRLRLSKAMTNDIINTTKFDSSTFDKSFQASFAHIIARHLPYFLHSQYYKKAMTAQKEKVKGGRFLLRKARVVVVGGSLGDASGAIIARALDKEPSFDAVFIDSSERFELTPAILCALRTKHNRVQEATQLYAIDHAKYLKNTKIITEFVSQISPNKIVLQNRTLYYDYLILCSGHCVYSGSFDGSLSSSAVKDFDIRHLVGQDLWNVKKIAIIGSGRLAIAAAFEALTCSPSTHVHIITKSKTLLEHIDEVVAEKIEKILRKKGVTFDFNVDTTKLKKTNKTYKGSGVTFKADKLLICEEGPDTEFLKHSFPDSLDTRSYVKVNQHMQVFGCPNIFAGGSVISNSKCISAESVQAQTSVIVKKS